MPPPTVRSAVGGVRSCSQWMLQRPAAMVVARRSSSSSSSSSSSPPSPSLPQSTIIPFAVPQLHVGTDICHVGRVYAILAKTSLAPRTPATPATSSTSTASVSTSTPAARLIRRVLTPHEVAALGPAPSAPAPTSPSSASSPASQPTPPPLPLPSTATPAQVVAWLATGGRASSDCRPKTKTDSTETATTTPPDPLLWKAAEHLAGRFAAKEAAIKAHPHIPDLTLQAVRIVRMGNGSSDANSKNGSGPPMALVRLPTRHEDAETVLEQEARLSISHDGDYATAICLGFQRGP